MSLWSTQPTPTVIVTRIKRCSNCQYVSALARKLIDIAFFHHYHPSIKLDDACHVSVTMGGSALHMNPVPWIVPESSSYWLRHNPVDPSGVMKDSATPFLVGKRAFDSRTGHAFTVIIVVKHANLLTKCLP
ncbi:hypothetical protein Agabi119p4_6202 [Agaricus bisporus var. burnettii]|uniref:Uncharacterized protein n=1 Tax=Agaricus bisporus var. burnettii TaxID=192524 RepID=A0A8H7F003_AGABI|nr:hypothetical protein Agabi119p4_6202 [Agaricus bisporus var. burnettii]